MSEKLPQVQAIEQLIAEPWSKHGVNLILGIFAEFELEATADLEEYVSHYLPARMVLLISSWNLPKLKVLRARYESLSVSENATTKEGDKKAQKGMIDEREARKEYIVDWNLIKAADEFITLAGSLAYEGACTLFTKLLADSEINKSLSRIQSLKQYLITTYNNTVAEKLSRIYDRMSAVEIAQLGVGENWIASTPQGISTAVIKKDVSDSQYYSLSSLEEARKLEPESAHNKSQQEQECLLQMRILAKMAADIESTSSSKFGSG